MAFEHYYRKGTKKLRCGYTTGTCAALAAAAATKLLLTGEAPESVELVTGKGIPVEVSVEKAGWGNVDETVSSDSETLKDRAWAAIPKDAGDDADVTDGLLIVAEVRRVEAGSSKCRSAEVRSAEVRRAEAGSSKCRSAEVRRAEVIKSESGRSEVRSAEASKFEEPVQDDSDGDPPLIIIDGGVGVGRVTKPGLDQPVGNAAINSGPRKMIEEEVRKVCQELGYEGGVEVIISVPEGEEAAKRTFNPNLGIEGGISILGTTGIVEPMSEQALVDTIEVTLKQIVAGGEKAGKDAAEATRGLRLILTPGNYGNSYIKGIHMEELEVPVLNISNFLGETLDMIGAVRERTIDSILLVAHVGKLSKVAAGVMNTHSKYADGRNEVFCAHAAMWGGTKELAENLMAAATTDACIELIDKFEKGMEERKGFRRDVTDSILAAVQEKLEHRTAGAYRIGAVMFSNVYGTLGMTKEGETILEEWRKVK